MYSIKFWNGTHSHTSIQLIAEYIVNVLTTCVRISNDTVLDIGIFMDHLKAINVNCDYCVSQMLEIYHTSRSFCESNFIDIFFLHLFSNRIGMADKWRILNVVVKIRIFPPTIENVFHSNYTTISIRLIWLSLFRSMWINLLWHLCIFSKSIHSNVFVFVCACTCAFYSIFLSCEKLFNIRIHIAWKCPINWSTLK